MKRPLMISAAGFVLGEVLALQYQAVLPGVLLLSAAGAGGLLLFFGLGKRIRFSFFLLLLFGMAGFFHMSRTAGRLDREEEAAAVYEGRTVTVSGRIRKAEEREDGWNLVLEEIRMQAGTQMQEGAAIQTGVVMQRGKTTGEREQTQRNCWRYAAVYLDQEVPGAELLPGCSVTLSGSMERIEGIRNPGEFDFRCYYRSRNIACRFYGKRILSLEGQPYPYERLLYGLKRHCRVVLEMICEPEDSMIYRAVLLGEGSAVSEETMDLYRRNGVGHLLAISGQHLAIIGGGIYGILRCMGMGFKKAGLAGGFLVISYGILTGSSGSAIRAVIMILCLWLGNWAGRTYDTLSALSLAAILLLWKQPYLLTQSGFQLSFAAVWSISGLGGWLWERSGFSDLEFKRTGRGGKGLVKLLLMNFCVQLATAPILLWHYYQYPPYGFFMNLLILPLVSVLMYSGILVILLGSFWPSAGLAAAGAGHYILRYYGELCLLAERLPGNNLVLGRPEWPQIGLYGVFLMGIMIETVSWKRIDCEKGGEGNEEGAGWIRQVSRAAVFTGLCAGCFLFLFPYPVHDLQILCLDVGQGDGILMETGRHSILIDGGSSSEKKLGSMTLEPCLKSRGISKIEYAIVSHGDNDHISGLLYLLEEGKDIAVGTLVLPSGGHGQEIYEKLEKLASARGADVIYMKAGDKISAGNLELSCLYDGEKAADRNSHSLVICADFKEFHMLFTGDMGIKEEERLLQLAEESGAQQSLHLNHAEVLKVAHHGSNGSSCEAFLERMPLKAAVVSYGVGNTYGHPSEEVIERLKKSRISVLGTGIGGAVFMETDGERLKAGYYCGGGV